MSKNNERILETYYKYYVIQGELTLKNQTTDQAVTKKINSKIGILKLIILDLPKIFERNQLKEVTKIATFNENKLKQIQDLKRQFQEAMFDDEKETQEISKWGCQLEDRLEVFIQGREKLEATIEKLRIAEEVISRTEETELEEIKLRKRTQEELKIKEARVKMTADLERKIREEERKDAKPEITVKLPKLEITKFKGNHLDWTRFWS